MAEIYKQIVAIILLLVFGVAHAELPNRNVQSCDAGYSSCNESLLTEEQKRTAHGYALGRNVQVESKRRRITPRLFLLETCRSTSETCAQFHTFAMFNH